MVQRKRLMSTTACVLTTQLMQTLFFETLITAKYPNNQESKLLNDFNAAVAGIEDESKKQPYLDFLQMRKELHAMVDADCQKYNYPMK